MDRPTTALSVSPTHAEQRMLPCPVCGTPSQFAQLSRDAALYRCSDCDHCFSDPESIQAVERYGPEYYEKNWFQDQLYSGHHLNHFNTTSLRTLMEDGGFPVDRLLLHDIPLAAVVVGASPVNAFIQRCGVLGIFLIGKLTRRNYLQTLVCSKEAAAF